MLHVSGGTNFSSKDSLALSEHNSDMGGELQQYATHNEMSLGLSSVASNSNNSNYQSSEVSSMKSYSATSANVGAKRKQSQLLPKSNIKSKFYK